MGKNNFSLDQYLIKENWAWALIANTNAKLDPKLNKHQ